MKMLRSVLKHFNFETLRDKSSKFHETQEQYVEPVQS